MTLLMKILPFSCKDGFFFGGTGVLLPDLRIIELLLLTFVLPVCAGESLQHSMIFWNR